MPAEYTKNDPTVSSAAIVLFAPGTPPPVRRRRLTFLAVYAVVISAVIWPLYALFAAPFPLLLGLPLSLAWMVLALAIIFIALLVLFRSESPKTEGAPTEESS